MTPQKRPHRSIGHLIAGLCAAVALISAGCTGAPAAAPRSVAPAPRGEAGATAVAEVVGDLSRAGFLDSADGLLRVSGKAGLLLSLKRMSAPPAAPAGWEFAGPVFDITAQDGQRRPVQQLASTLSLRFDVRGHDRPLTVMVYRDGAWRVVESEMDADGRLMAEVDHLTPYTVAGPAPKAPGGARTDAAAKTQPTRTPAARSTPAAGRPTPAATSGARRMPVATTSVSSIASADAQKVLAAAAAALKGKNVKVSSAMGYSGSLAVPVPDELWESLGAALSANGTGYYGMYSGVNQVIVVQAAGGGANGSLTLLVEPKTALPANATDAEAQLIQLFPGIGADLTPAKAMTNGYTFYRISGNTAYAAGYSQYEGLVLAYAMSGSGSYQALVAQR